jgi:hypothetical protein
MKHSTVSRGLVAIATVLGLMILSAPPASADPPEDVVGSFTVGGDEELLVGGAWANMCEARNIDMSFFGTEDSGVWDVWGTMWVPFTISSDPSQTKYEAEISFFSSSGGFYDQWWPYLNGTLNIQIVIRTLEKMGVWWNPLDDCTTSNPICTIRTRLIVDMAQSSHVGTMPTPVTGDTTNLVASTESAGGIRPVVTSGTCPVTIQGGIVGQSVVSTFTLVW